MRPFKPWLLLALLAGCGADPLLYLLPPPLPAEAQATRAGSIAVAEIGLPTYAESDEIARLGLGGAVEVDSDALWADTPRRALTRHLIAALQARLDARIAGEPWPELDRPGLRLEVIADRLIGTPGGLLQFTGAYNVVAPESGRIVSADRFIVTVPVPGEDYGALLAAHARAVDALADLLVPRLTQLDAGV